METKAITITLPNEKTYIVDYSPDGKGFIGTIYTKPATNFKIYLLREGHVLSSNPQLSPGIIGILADAIRKNESL